METDADRLALLNSLGAESIQHPLGTFQAIVDTPFDMVDGDVSVEQSQPGLVARTSDVKDLTKNTVLMRGVESYRLVRQEPDGTGMTRLVLKRS